VRRVVNVRPDGQRVSRRCPACHSRRLPGSGWSGSSSERTRFLFAAFALTVTGAESYFLLAQTAELLLHFWTGAEIQAVLKGAETLEGPWEDVPEGGSPGQLAPPLTARPTMRFFKVVVELP